METKVCSKCRVEKSLEEFYKQRSKKSGYRSHCKLCTEEYKKLYSKKNKEVIATNKKQYYKENKEKILAYYKYNIKVKDNQIEYRKKNKLYFSEYKKLYLQTERGKAAAARARHKRRQLEKQTEASLTDVQWAAILGMQQYQCARCGEYFDVVEPTRDHVVPASKGGGLTMLNTQALCRSCNSIKNNKMIDYRTDNHKTTIRVLTNGN